MGQYRQWLVELEGIEAAVAVIAGLVVMAVIGWVVNIIAKRVLLGVVKHAVKRSRTKWDDVMLAHGVFRRLTYLAPAVAIYALAPIAFAGATAVANVVQLTAIVYMVIVGLGVVNALLDSAVEIYRTYEFSRKVPVGGFVQLAKAILYFVAGVIIISTILKKDPSKLLTGMTAMTAVLLLVFKDSILGFIAGIQLSANRMVHIGDWIEMPKYGADGDVIDISLTTIKVQNWDKTISSIPVYALISDSFKNWRGMKESGGRRIKRSIYIDMSTIRFCTDEMLARFKKFQYISDYVEAKKSELAEYNKSQNVDESEPVNGRRLTNVGTFRAYITAYLRNHPKIDNDMTFLIRHLEPTSKGLPIQIYVFCSDQAWANYEGVQADIFDHVLAVVPEFELRLFQEPAGADFNSPFFIKKSEDR